MFDERVQLVLYGSQGFHRVFTVFFQNHDVILSNQLGGTALCVLVNADQLLIQEKFLHLGI